MKNFKREKTDTFFYFIKNIFILLLFLQFAPTILSNIKTSIVNAIQPKTEIGFLKMEGILTNSSYYLKKIETFFKEDRIKGLIFKINCPGGMPGSAQAIFNELNKFKNKKPVVVVIENVCTSAAYYVAIASNIIIANPSSLIGGIGVLLELPNIKELLNSWKIKFNYVQSGKYKTAGSPLKEASPDELNYLQKLSDNTYAQFIKDVSETRGISDKNFTRWADGKVFTGNQSLELKLIDQLGSLQDGIDQIKKLADIKTEVKLIRPQRVSGFLRLLGVSEDDYEIEGYSFAEKVACFVNTIYSKFIQHQSIENNPIKIE